MVRIPSVLTYTSLRSATDSDTAPGSFLLPHATGPTSACGNGANAAKTNYRYLTAVPGRILGRLADLSDSSILLGHRNSPHSWDCPSVDPLMVRSSMLHGSLTDSKRRH